MRKCFNIFFILTVFLLCPAQSFALEPGDFVFVDTFGVWTGIGYSSMREHLGVGVGHVGIYIGEKNGVRTIIHCPADWSVEEISFKGFISDGIYRGAKTTKPPPTKKQREKIIDFAISQIGKPFSRNPWSSKGPAGYNCSGLAEAAYEYAGLDPTPWWFGDMPFRYIWPIELYNSPNMQESVAGIVFPDTAGFFSISRTLTDIAPYILLGKLIFVVGLRRYRLRNTIKKPSPA